MSKTKKKVRIPTVKIPARKGKQSKSKAKVKPRPKRKPAPALTTPPVGMAPPQMEDTRPTPDPTPTPAATSGSSSSAAPTPLMTEPKPSSASTESSVDAKMAQGTECTWIGTMGETIGGSGLNICPSCGGHVTPVIGDRETLRMGFEMYELGAYTSVNPPPRRHPGYGKFMAWVVEQSKLPKCWPGADAAAEAYYEETGTRVDPAR